jgi:hypothetical protein
MFPIGCLEFELEEVSVWRGFFEGDRVESGRRLKNNPRQADLFGIKNRLFHSGKNRVL